METLIVSGPSRATAGSQEQGQGAKHARRVRRGLCEITLRNEAKSHDEARKSSAALALLRVRSRRRGRSK
eukprot:635710-Prymnesium_polylepis.1